MITCMNQEERSRGVQQGAVHQGTIVTVLNHIVSFTGHVAFLRLVDDLDLDRIVGVVEVNDVDVKD